MQIQEIINQCCCGQQSAQLELYNLLSKSVYNATLRVIGDTQTAEEIMHDAFIIALKQIEKYKHTPEKIHNSIRRIAVNKAIDQLRKKKIITQDISPLEYKITQTEEPPTTPNPTKIKEIYTAIELLPQGYKTILTLKIIEEMPTEEIAQKLGIKSATVRTQYLRAKEKVREIIRKQHTHGNNEGNNKK